MFAPIGGRKMTGISNYHTHNVLCRHASGTVADYVAQAEKDGCSALGMSSHCPYPPGPVADWSDSRMRESEIGIYMNQVRSAAGKVSFPVYAGFECEGAGEFESWYRDRLLGEAGADYLVLGAHWVRDGSDYIYILDVDSRGLFHKYIDQTIDAVRSGIYKFLAHPDLMMGAYRNWDDDARAMFCALLDATEDCGLPVEINGNGMLRGKIMTRNGMRYMYPYDEFWDMAAERNLTVICSSDAHVPENVIKAAAMARDFAGVHGIIPADTLAF